MIARKTVYLYYSTAAAFLEISCSSYSFSAVFAFAPAAFRPKTVIRTTTAVTAKRLPNTVLFETDVNGDECSIEEEDIFDCLAHEGYVEVADDPSALIQKVYVAEIESLRGKFHSFETEPDQGSNMIKFHKRKVEVLKTAANGTSTNGNTPTTTSTQKNTHQANMEYNRLIGDGELVLVDTVRAPGMVSVSRAFRRAGPRKILHFDPTKVNAAIVTCGGLCPGLNNVVREITHSLYYLYGANEVWGIVGGFHGFHDNNSGYEPIHLTNEFVDKIHHEGGTVLRSARGGFDVETILAFLVQHNIQHLYVVGGDGTHRAAYKIHQACLQSDMNVAVAGIPKTIDNDIDFIDRSFGFTTAVEAAQDAIQTAKIEAMCKVPNGIGVIKLMGRSAGFLAAFAALGSGDVDAVLVPEVPIVLEGENGILPFIRQRVKEQKYAVVVVAEGAGEELLGQSTEVDRGGNRKLPEIAEFIRDQIKDYFEKQGDTCTMTYVDPSYMVRAKTANAADSLYCMQLAQNAVHGAMAGYTGFSTGLVNNRVVYLPIPQLVASSPRSMNPHGITWERILAMTGQPNTVDAKVPPLVVNGDKFPELPEVTMN